MHHFYKTFFFTLTGLLAIGAVEAVSLVAVGSAGVTGGVGTGALATWLFQERVINGNYHAVLEYIVRELVEKWESDKEKQVSEAFQEITDLRRDGRTYSLEKALLLLHISSEGLSNFDQTKLSKCTKDSLEALDKRIRCIGAVHEIRNLLASQCYIGIVGIQDAGNIFCFLLLVASKLEWTWKLRF
jgi:hypothetical protein